MTRVKIFWIIRILKIITSSSYNSIRNEGEFEISKKFNRYLSILNNQEKDELVNKLKYNLDQESKNEVDMLIDRQEYILQHNLLEQKKLFTKQELLEQKEWSKLSLEMKKRMDRFNINNFCAESFYGINGLKWLPKHIQQKLIHGVFLDVGACDGDSALIFNFTYNPHKIYSFEPEINNFNRLKKNIEILNTDKIEIINCGISDISGKAAISDKGGSSCITNNEHGNTELITLDDFVEANKITKIDLIKMDIEGMEMKALISATNIIKKYKPILAISIYHKPEDFFEIKPWLETLCSGYKFIIKKANPISLTQEVLLLAYTE